MQMQQLQLQPIGLASHRFVQGRWPFAVCQVVVVVELGKRLNAVTEPSCLGHCPEVRFAARLDSRWLRDLGVAPAAQEAICVGLTTGAAQQCSAVALPALLRCTALTLYGHQLIPTLSHPEVHDLLRGTLHQLQPLLQAVPLPHGLLVLVEQPCQRTLLLACSEQADTATHHKGNTMHCISGGGGVIRTTMSAGAREPGC